MEWGCVFNFASASFTQHNTFEIYPHDCKYQHLTAFHGCVVFHCMSTSQFILSFLTKKKTNLKKKKIFHFLNPPESRITRRRVKRRKRSSLFWAHSLLGIFAIALSLAQNACVPKLWHGWHPSLILISVWWSLPWRLSWSPSSSSLCLLPGILHHITHCYTL